MENENWQRLKNLAIFKIWATDRQMRKMWPIFMILLLALFLVVSIWWLTTT